MVFEINSPIVSALLIPILFIILEFIFATVFIHNRTRKRVRGNPAKPKKYISEFHVIGKLQTPSHSGEMDFDELCTFLEENGTATNPSSKIKIIDIHELSPDIEKFNFGLQMILAAMSVQLSTIIILSVNSKLEGPYIGWGVISIIFYFFFSAIVVAIRNQVDPDKHDYRLRFVLHIFAANFVGF
jgi:hypothetical protein